MEGYRHQGECVREIFQFLTSFKIRLMIGKKEGDGDALKRGVHPAKSTELNLPARNGKDRHTRGSQRPWKKNTGVQKHKHQGENAKQRSRQTMSEFIIPKQQNRPRLKILKGQAPHVIAAGWKLRNAFIQHILHCCDREIFVHRQRTRAEAIESDE